jgi:tetratricopeptide (TPR) repeat protein
MNSCPVCKKHLVIPLAQWQEAKEEMFEDVLGKYRKKSSNPKVVMELLEALAMYQDRELFTELAPEIVEAHSDNAEVLKVIGGMYADMGFLAEADETLCASLALQGDWDVCERLAVVLIRSDEPAEAEPYMEHIITEKIVDKAVYLIFLAEGYEAVGQHVKALEVLDKAVGVSERLGKNKRYKKVRKIAEKNRKGSKAIKSESLKPIVQVRSQENWSRIAKFVGPLVLATILVIYMLIAYISGRSRAVYFVNGLSRPYTVEVNGEAHLLRSLRPVRIKVGEGEITVEVKGEGPGIATETHNIQTSFWARPFLKKTYVIRDFPYTLH